MQLVGNRAFLLKMCRYPQLHNYLRLHKFISNSKEVIAKIAPEDRAKGVKDLDLHNGVLPIERALGVQ